MSVAANMMMFNSSRIEREEREVYEKALKLLQRAAGISGETTDDIKNFVFDIYINGKVLSSLRASYPQYSLSDDSSILLDIWNQVDHQVRNSWRNNLKRKFASENGTDFNNILPKMSPLNPQYLTKKQTVFQKIVTFIEKFKGVGEQL